MTQPTDDFIQQMPKSEIHIHLEGAIQPETALKLADRHDAMHKLPGKTVEDIRNWFTFVDFPNFVKIYMVIQDLLQTGADFELIAYENGKDMAAQNIRYRELTLTTFTHTHYQDKSITIDEILEGLEAGRQRAKQEFGVEMRWVFDIPRNLGFNEGVYVPETAVLTLEHAIQGKGVGVVGFGLGGYEVGAPPEPYAHAFTKAKEAGLLSVPHAGETMGAGSIWGCLNELKADRIGHGVRSIEDPNLLAYLKEHQIPLEVNPTSNICLGVYRSLPEHPFPHLDKMGLFVTVNSDDPPFFNTDLVQEYKVLRDVFGYDQDNILRIARRAFTAAGADDVTKEALVAEFDRWVEQQ